MFNFFASKVKVFGRVKSTLLNQTSEGVFFRWRKKNEIEICQKSKALLLFFYYYFKGFHVLLIDFEGNYD